MGQGYSFSNLIVFVSTVGVCMFLCMNNITILACNLFLTIQNAALLLLYSSGFGDRDNQCHLIFCSFCSPSYQNDVFMLPAPHYIILNK